MAILITGGCGYIGSELIRKLYQDGKTPVSYDILPIPNSLLDLKDKVKFLRGDVRNLTGLINTLKNENIECIIHPVSLLVADSQENPVSAYEINIGGTVNILEAARIMDVKRVVYLSSAAVYGGSAKVEHIPEEYPLNPVTLYGATKVACEHFGINYAKNYGIDFVSLRLSYVWGPGRKRGVDKLATIVENPIHGLAAKVSGGSQKYEPIYMKDVIKAIVLACYAPKTEHRIFNIGSEEMITLQEVADMVKENIRDAEIEISPGYDLCITDRACIDISKAREELGYEVDFKMGKALKDYIGQIRSNLF
jgi:nucleoside-diphosphate-sugar epimerase